MTRFIIGLLLGLLIGIGGTAAFLITANGGDYLIVASPRVRELEASLKNVDQDRQWLRARLGEANDSLAKLESRFSSLTARFDGLATSAAHDGATITPTPSATLGEPTASPEPADVGADERRDPSAAPVERPATSGREPAAF